MNSAGIAVLFMVSSSIPIRLEAVSLLPIPLGCRHHGWQRLGYGQGVAGNWDSNVAQAAVAVAARFGVGVAVAVGVEVRVAVTT